MAKKKTEAVNSQTKQLVVVLGLTLAVVAVFLLVGVLEAEPAIDNVYTAVTVLCVLSILLAVVVYFKYTGRLQPSVTSYESMLNIGIVFFIVGLATGSSTFWILGLVYMISGYSGKQRGGKPPSERDKRIMLTVAVAFFILFILGALVYFMFGA